MTQKNETVVTLALEAKVLELLPDTYLARWIEKGNHLDGRHIRKAAWKINKLMSPKPISKKTKKVQKDEPTIKNEPTLAQQDNSSAPRMELTSGHVIMRQHLRRMESALGDSKAKHVPMVKAIIKDMENLLN